MRSSHGWRARRPPPSSARKQPPGLKSEAFSGLKSEASWSLLKGEALDAQRHAAHPAGARRVRIASGAFRIASSAFRNNVALWSCSRCLPNRRRHRREKTQADMTGHVFHAVGDHIHAAGRPDCEYNRPLSSARAPSDTPSDTISGPIDHHTENAGDLAVERRK